MNTTTNTAQQLDDGNTIEGQVRVVEVDHAQAVLNPALYATMLFEPFLAEITVARRKASRSQYDPTTPEGLAVAKDFRTIFQKVRTRADKLKSERKKPIDQAGKAILEQFKRVEEAAKIEEDKHDQVIRAEEARQAAEKQRKLDEERARVEALQHKVDAIRTAPNTVRGKPSAEVQDLLEYWRLYRVNPADFEDHVEEALIAVEGTVNELQQLLDKTLADEAEQRRVQAERAELARLKEEQAAREREAQAQQAAVERQQKIMQDIAMIQKRAQVAGSAAVLHLALANLVAMPINAERFGDMVPMAEMARGIAVQALQTKLDAQKAIEAQQKQDQAAAAAAVEAIEPGPAYVDQDEPVPVEVPPRGRMLVASPALVRARPSAEEMIIKLAAIYDEDEETVERWMIEAVQQELIA